MKRVSVWSILVIFAFIISGCGGPHFGDKNGWSDDQKKEFEAILATDKYASLCNLKPLYDKYLQTKDSAVLSSILVGYVKNLENSCIDISAFKRVQRARRAKKIHTAYEMNIKSVSESAVYSKLKDGYTIEEILKPHIPKAPQFHKLLTKYLAHRNGKGMSTSNYKKLRVSLERTKLLSDEGWDTYFIVNVPEFMLRFFEKGHMKMKFPIIVGKKRWQTPIFSADMKYLALNPTWNVPDNIARAEEIPSIVRNKNYFKRKHVVVLKSYDLNSKPVDPHSINWKEYLKPEYKKKPIPYKLIQQPSSRNALGRVKFMFPNSHSVYMHDTPRKSLFKRKNRAFSHGCMRLSKPLYMLKYLANHGYLKYSPQEVDKLLAKGKQKYINFYKYIPVHVVYLTAFVDADGSIKFSNDIYGYDSIQRIKGE